VALSLASGFVEPLESTSIHLIMTGVTRLMQLFPFGGIAPATVTRFNDQAQAELERVRDFIILHYHLNERPEPFWADRRERPIPDTLVERIALFAEGGQAYQGGEDLFRVASWVQVMLGQRLTPRDYHRLGSIMGSTRLASVLGNIRAGITQTVASMPTHQQFLDRHLATSIDASSAATR
jgi:tryptophan halogenase